MCELPWSRVALYKEMVLGFQLSCTMIGMLLYACAYLHANACIHQGTAAVEICQSMH